MLPVYNVWLLTDQNAHAYTQIFGIGEFETTAGKSSFYANKM